MKCIACNKEILNASINCPHCGYRFSIDDSRICPNRIGAICQLTENLCNKGIDYMDCNIKVDVEKESFFN